MLGVCGYDRVPLVIIDTTTRGSPDIFGTSERLHECYTAGASYSYL